jgi:CMP/dCMP kinase
MEDMKPMADTASIAPIAKKKIITIAGRPGSGKSTTAKAVAEELGYQHFSSGDLFRALGKERGIDVLQANLTAEENTELDNLVDARLREMGTTETQLVIDSRMAWHWMPASFKVFLDLDLTVASQRIIGKMDEARLIHEHIPQDPAEYAVHLQQRLDSEGRRYKTLYDVNPFDTSNYDLVVDTEANNIEQVIALVLKEYRNWLQ